MKFDWYIKIKAYLHYKRYVLGIRIKGGRRGKERSNRIFRYIDDKIKTYNFYYLIYIYRYIRSIIILIY
jgi:hypothetical protein